MDFDLSQDQRMLVDTAASFVKKQSPVTRLRTMREDATGWSRDVWRHMGELGWLGILFAEDVGGFGGTFVDAALILEQLGNTLVPEPYVPSVLLAGGAIDRAGTAEQRTRYLAPLIEGTTSLALAYAETGSRYDTSRVSSRAERKGGSYRLTGKKVFVLNGHAADALVVSARTSGGPGDRDGISLFVVDPKASGVAISPIKTMDGHHAANIELVGVEVGEEALLGSEGTAGPLLEQLMDLGAAAACAEGAGIMKTVLQMTTEYLKTREQFGVKIGTFQALQHRAVDMFIETELAKSTAILASIKVASTDEVERKTAVSAAKVQLAVSGRLVTQQSIQLHGGIGVTDEHDVGLYFKRMHVLNSLFGDEEHHLERFATLPSFTADLDA
jgi:alkylation response protein AidB-like acyl-CoA dehydrogenase